MSRCRFFDGRIAAVVLAAAISGSAIAAEPSAHQLALAAGYKAAFLCSDSFTAGQTETQIAANDLTGIYPEYQPLLADLPALIDRSAKTVSVAFDAKLPPRVAAWRPLLGCAQLPIGAAPETASALPRLALTAPNLAAGDARPWPLGDAGAVKRPAGSVAAKLDGAVARAFDAASFGKGSATTAVVIVQHDKIIAERYRADFDKHRPQRTWSVAKSLTATLVGRAVLLGKADVNAPANIPEWRAPGDPRAAITLAQLLRMNSGLWTNGPGNRSDGIYIGGQSVPEAAASMPLEALPGSRFRYANDDIMLAAYSLKTSLGDDALAFPFTALLWPLGMTRTTPETDWQGHYVLSSQVWTTARDLARLGLLYANGGTVVGQRLLPGDWPAFVATPAGAQPTDRSGYGAGFWLQSGAGIPAGTYAMIGNRGQYVVIVPARDIVIVRRGYDAGDTPFDINRFVAACLAALGT